jgi:hypothetical protein
MDGGISPSSTHSDVLAGAERVLIFSMMSRPPESGSFGLTMRTNPDEIHHDPAQLENALALGAARAETDIADLTSFWND